MSYFRHPRTKNEKTQYFAAQSDEVEVPVKIRKRRSPFKLASVYDERVSSLYGSRSWKAYRKNQWK